MRYAGERTHGSVGCHIHNMPGVPACICENPQVSILWRMGVGDEFKASIGVGRTRSDGLPRSNGHGNGSNPKNRPRTVAEKERIHHPQVTSELLDAGKYPLTRLTLELRPLVIPVCAQPACLNPR